MRSHRIVAAFLVLVQLGCLLVWLPAPLRLLISVAFGVLTVATLVRADWQSPVGRTWVVATSVAVILFNLVLCFAFLVEDDGGSSIGGGLAIGGVILLMGFTAAALIASYLGSLLAVHLDKTTEAPTVDDHR